MLHFHAVTDEDSHPCISKMNQAGDYVNAVTDGDGLPLENEDESGWRLCEYWSTILEARIAGERHHCHDTILPNVQTAPDDKQ